MINLGLYLERFKKNQVSKVSNENIIVVKSHQTISNRGGGGQKHSPSREGGGDLGIVHKFYIVINSDGLPKAVHKISMSHGTGRTVYVCGVFGGMVGDVNLL